MKLKKFNLERKFSCWWLRSVYSNNIYYVSVVYNVGFVDVYYVSNFDSVLSVCIIV